MAKFDFVIGNPPYQDDSALNTRKPPVYHLFMDEANKVADRVEFITPARFLFEAGQTPKEWNRKMLNDSSFKVLEYYSDGTEVFPNTDIKGGVTITYKEKGKDFGAIKIFTPYAELNTTLRKIITRDDFEGLDKIVSSRGNYRFTSKFFEDYPDAPSKLGKGTGNMLVSNSFEKLVNAFSSTLTPNSIKILGRVDNARTYKYLDKKYLQRNDYLSSFNVLIPKSSGSGKFGEPLSPPEISNAGEAATDTFISIGKLNSEEEAINLLRYLKTKFVRALLSVKKVTQDNPKSVWAMIPIQSFTTESDIDWDLPISKIDAQLYKKYGLSPEEIEFIETNVKEME